MAAFIQFFARQYARKSSTHAEVRRWGAVFMHPLPTAGGVSDGAGRLRCTYGGRLLLDGVEVAVEVL